MAEILVEKLLDELTDAVFTKLQEEFKLVTGVKAEVKNLSSKLQIIKRMLQDAQRRKLKEEPVGIWLEKLEDVAYDMDDVLDEWNTEIQKLKVKADEDPNSPSPKLNKKVAMDLRNKVCSLLQSICSCFKEVSLRHDVAQKIKDLNGAIDNIFREADAFKFDMENLNCSSEEFKHVITTSDFDKLEVCGRESDKDTIVSKLLSDTSNAHDDIQIVSVVGLGGIGKTTLAQLVYNEYQVNNHFELRIWVCVSDPFDQKRIAKAILEGLKVSSNELSEFETLAQRIKETISRKKFLLVLDDVWTEKKAEWKPILNSLKDGATGSRILVTTRSEKVARMMGTHYLHPLNQLNDSDCWKILSQIALLGRSKNECEKFEKIGKEISKKCKGSPLAASFLGSLLQSKDTIDEWKNILESEIWELEESKINLFPHIYLSYKELSAEMKRCFSYCAIFPKDSEIEVDYLIRLWAAQGYLRSSGRVGELESRGYECFSNLAMRSFFQNVKRSDPFDNARISWCKMHDIVHDFAQYLTNGECLIIENLDKAKNLSHGHVRHLTWSCEDDVALSGIVNNVEKLRGFLGASKRIVQSDLFDRLKCVRTLGLFDNDLDQVPKAIGKMIHLRFLDLSRNESLEVLPEEICELYNLEYLNISYCINLTQFPQRIGKLKNLRELINSRTDGLKQVSQELERLTSLQRLDEFKVGNGYNKLGYLRNLNLLKGKLEIQIFEVNEMNFDDAVFGKKTHIQGLCFKFKSTNCASVMKDQQLPPNLEFLQLTKYPNTELPSWIMSLNNIKILGITKGNVALLPPLGKLPSLEALQLEKLSLKVLSHEFLGITDSDAVRTPFPNLKILSFDDLKYFKVWEDLRKEDEEVVPTVMPRLEELSIRNCDKLEILPYRLLRKLSKSTAVLKVFWCEALTKGYSNREAEFRGKIQLSSLLTTYPIIESCIQLESLPAMAACVWSNDSNLQLEATTQFRKLLSAGKYFLIKKVIKSGVVPQFLEFLARNDYPELQIEAVLALAYIACGNFKYTKVVIDHGALQIFVKLLSSPSDDICEQAIFALGKIVKWSPECRNLALSHGALMPLLAQINEDAKGSMCLQAKRTFLYFCRGDLSFEEMKLALPILARLMHSNDEKILKNACLALSILTGNGARIQAVIEAGVCPRLLEPLLYPSSDVLMYVLWTVGNIVACSNIQTQVFINELLPYLLNFLTKDYHSIIKSKACWVISKIAAGNREQIQAVIQAGIVAPLVQLLQNDDRSIVSKAVDAIVNATSSGTYEQIKFLVSQGCIKPLCDLLDKEGFGLFVYYHSLEGLENILKVGEVEKNFGNTGDVNVFAQMIDDAEGLEKIKKLKNLPYRDIREKAVNVLKTYWLLDKDDEQLPSTYK